MSFVGFGVVAITVSGLAPRRSPNSALHPDALPVFSHRQASSRLSTMPVGE
jgi:hypothetical protein